MMKPTDDKTIQTNGQSPAAGEPPDQEKKPEQATTPAASETASTEAKAEEAKPAETKPAETKAPETKPEDKAEETKPEVDDRPTIALTGLRPAAPPVPSTPVVTAPPVPAVPAPTLPAPASGMAMPGMSKPVAPTPADAASAEAPGKSGEATAPAVEVKPVEVGKADADSPKRPRKAIDATQAHVLVVEDNVPNFVLIARMLAYMGVQRCEWKTSGWQVVEFADTLPRIDLILMDIRLPYEDGFQALEKVRANARLKDTLVVAVTAEASVDQMKRAQESGFDGFLSKPLDPDRFPEQIRRVLNGESVWEIH
jgi:two-component system, cell cycle response regulator DivK